MFLWPVANFGWVGPTGAAFVTSRSRELEPSVWVALLRRVPAGPTPSSWCASLERVAKDAYMQRVHRVTDYIRRHLADELTLEKLARHAHFSPFHFHRVFKSVTGETVAAFARRARLERAVYLMRGAPDRTLTSVALDAGFGTPSDFSRVFRSAYGIAPSAWDRRSRLDGKPDFAGDSRESKAKEPQPEARVADYPACIIAYVRVHDPWRGSHLADGYAALTEWLSQVGVPWRSSSLLGVSWDSELATPLERLVYDLGIAVPADLRPSERFGIQAIPDVTAVEVHCTSLPQIALAWDYLYTEWLPASGYEPADLPAIKRFRRTPDVFDQQAWDVDCSIALRPSRP